MGWANDAVKELEAGRRAQVQPFGGSMRGRIESGQLVTLEPIGQRHLRMGDVVLVRWKNNFLLHLIVSLTPDAVAIGNNLGKINGSVSPTDVLGIATEVVDEPLAAATVVSHSNGFCFRVRFEDGREVEARVKKDTARLMFRIAGGDRVIISGLWNRQYFIKGFERSP